MLDRLLRELQTRLARGEKLASDAPVLAASHGYADESHLNRECRCLTGLSIGTYLA